MELVDDLAFKHMILCDLVDIHKGQTVVTEHTFGSDILVLDGMVIVNYSL